MQVFDGITAAVFSVMVPLIVADVAFGSGHFNLAQGIVGTATGIGASLSTVLAGYVSDKFGSSVAFTGLGRRRRAGPRHDLAGDAGDAAGAGKKGHRPAHIHARTVPHLVVQDSLLGGRWRTQPVPR